VISVSGPTYRLNGQRTKRATKDLLEAAKAITQELGGVPTISKSA